VKTVPLNFMHHIMFKQHACTHWVAFIKEGGGITGCNIRPYSSSDFLAYFSSLSCYSSISQTEEFY